MNTLNNDLLYKSSTEVLQQLKNDADDCLKSWHETESIISQKANNMLQFLVPLVIAIFGFMITKFDNFEFDRLLIACLIEIIILCLSIYYIYSLINLKPVALLGVYPSDILSEDTYEDYNHYLRVRISGLQKALDSNELVHIERIKNYKSALRILVGGTIGLILVFSLLLIL